MCLKLQFKSAFVYRAPFGLVLSFPFSSPLSPPFRILFGLPFRFPFLPNSCEVKAASRQRRPNHYIILTTFNLNLPIVSNAFGIPSRIPGVPSGIPFRLPFRIRFRIRCVSLFVSLFGPQRFEVKAARRPRRPEL